MRRSDVIDDDVFDAGNIRHHVQSIIEHHDVILVSFPIDVDRI